jgi:ribosomal protein S27E
MHSEETGNPDEQVKASGAADFMRILCPECKSELNIRL